MSQAILTHSRSCRIQKLKQAGRPEKVQVSGVWVLIFKESMPGFTLALPLVIDSRKSPCVISLNAQCPLHGGEDSAMPNHQGDEDRQWNKKYRPGKEGSKTCVNQPSGYQRYNKSKVAGLNVLSFALLGGVGSRACAAGVMEVRIVCGRQPTFIIFFPIGWNPFLTLGVCLAGIL